jgi:hypothetical protein
LLEEDVTFGLDEEFYTFGGEKSPIATTSVSVGNSK